MPAVKEAVILEATATEEGLVGVQGLGTCQWRYVRTVGEGGRGREGKERKREGGREGEGESERERERGRGRGKEGWKEGGRKMKGRG